MCVCVCGDAEVVKVMVVVVVEEEEVETLVKKMIRRMSPGRKLWIVRVRFHTYLLDSLVTNSHQE